GGADRGTVGALLAEEKLPAAAGRDRHLDRQADGPHRAERRFADARRRSLDRSRDAPPRPRGVSMTSRFGRGLRRFVDSLQRGLFDDVVEAPVEPALAGAPSADSVVATDPLLRHPEATRELSL